MIIEIPLNATKSNFSQLSKLDGVDYELNFRWNSRDFTWYLNILRDGSSVLSSIAMVPDFPIVINGYKQSRFPGMLLVISSNHEKPGLSDLGETMSLFYIDESEFQA